MKKVLFVLTSHAELGTTGRETGVYLEELAVPYWYLLDRGHAIRIASIAGGEVPIDPASREPAALSASVERFLADEQAMAALRDTPAIDTCSIADFDALYLPGGHGTMWDLPSSDALARLVGDAFDAGRIVAAVCHGPAGLVSATLADGKPLVAGRRVAAFTDEEEAAAGLSDTVPFLLEQRLRELGADVVVAPKFTSNVVRDGRLVTGQNPQSSDEIAAAIGAALEEMPA
jgi:putative intracellular protease/amidase